MDESSSEGSVNVLLADASVVVAVVVRASVIDGNTVDACLTCLEESLALSIPGTCSESGELKEPARDNSDLENDPDVNGEEEERDEGVENEEEEENDGVKGGLDLWVVVNGSS